MRHAHVVHTWVRYSDSFVQAPLTAPVNGSREDLTQSLHHFSQTSTEVLVNSPCLKREVLQQHPAFPGGPGLLAEKVTIWRNTSGAHYHGQLPSPLPPSSIPPPIFSSKKSTQAELGLIRFTAASADLQSRWLLVPLLFLCLFHPLEKFVGEEKTRDFCSY